ncbi:MAG: hypothetical protein ACXVRJ_07625 [Gaiellaceae bacterium]
MGTVTAKLDGSTTLTSGGLINLDTLGVGAHTIVVTATDALGNVSSQTITFQIHATVTGLINAVNEGASRGLITASEAAVLVSELQSALKGNSGKTKISQSLSMVQSAERRLDQCGLRGAAHRLGERPAAHVQIAPDELPAPALVPRRRPPR